MDDVISFEITEFIPKIVSTLYILIKISNTSFTIKLNE
jgi:hypothetical protein